MVMPLSAPVRAIVGLASSSLFLAQITPAPQNIVDSAGRMSLDIALIAAVIWLRQQYTAKDAEKTAQAIAHEQRIATNQAAYEKRIAEKDEHIEKLSTQNMAISLKMTEAMTLAMESGRELRVAVVESSKELREMKSLIVRAAGSMGLTRRGDSQPKS